jgi:hypothetical protein
MFKKILIALVVLALLALLAFGLAVRKLPSLVVQQLRQTLGREVSVESIRLDFPFRAKMTGLLITENEPFKGEPAFFVQSAVATVDLLQIVTSKKLVFLNLELTRPRIIFRKQAGKVYNAFRLKPAEVRTTGVGAPSGSAASPVLLPIEFKRILIRDGELQLMDYDVDHKGFVISLLRVTAEIEDLTLPSDNRRISFALESFLDQGRDTPAAHLTFSGDWRRVTMDGKAEMKLTGLSLPYFSPYTAFVTPAQISDGEFDLAATAQSREGDLTANSRWSLRRLAFAKTEAGDELFGFDANAIKNILTGGSGNISLDLVLRMNLRDRKTPFGTILRKSLRSSIKVNFLTSFNSAVQSTVSQIVTEISDPSKKQNWKDLIKKNKLEDVVNKVMGQQ